MSLLVGMHDRLRLFHVLAGDLALAGEFPIKRCHVARFAHGGHMFAAARANAIAVFNTHSQQVSC